MIEVGRVIVSMDCLTEPFACDLERCQGRCCVEGDAGAPVTLDEVAALERALPVVEQELAPAARRVIEKQGVAYTDGDGDLVTSIVDGRDCVFTCYEGGCCLCAVERAAGRGLTAEEKPLSCALYPIRVKALSGGGFALNYHRWSVCRPAVERGRREGIKVWQFLQKPLTRAFGQAWYAELASTEAALVEAGLLESGHPKKTEGKEERI